MEKLSLNTERKVELEMPDGSGSLSDFVIDNSVPAHNNEEFLAGFTHMILVSRKQPEFNNEHEMAMWQKAMKRKEVTPLEAYNAFWEAFSDPYTPASGIEWKNLWKHIEKSREESYNPGDVDWEAIEQTRNKFDIKPDNQNQNG